MEIIHHFGLSIRREIDAEAFRVLGIHLDRGPQHLPGSSIAAFDISEDDPRWVEVQQLVERIKLTDFVRTKFSKSELGDASVLAMFATTQRGYPEPSNDMSFIEVTYDLSEYCNICGIGLRQLRPIRVGFVPTLQRSILALNWIFDEFLVSPQVWERVFRPFGIGYWPVLSARTGETIESVVQLRIEERAGLRLRGLERACCSDCGREKVLFNLRGFAPDPVNIPSPIFRSVQYFGTGANAFNLILVEAPLYRAIREGQLRGLEFYPCSPESSHISGCV